MCSKSVHAEPQYLDGYPSLAAFISSDHDQTSAIFKRFNRTAARNLLHLQSELAELQARQDALDNAEWGGGVALKQYSRNWNDFCHAARCDSRQQKRKELGETIRVVLKEYREALFFESHLASLPLPTKKTHQAFRNQFFHGDLESGYPMLGGQSATLFDDRDDLVALGTRVYRGNIVYASDLHISRFVAILSTFNAAALLIGAIVCLYAVVSPTKKLGIIAAFTTLFAANVGLLTNARRAELFAATAGYAAVLVVFVSGNLGSDGGGYCGTPIS